MTTSPLNSSDSQSVAEARAVYQFTKKRLDDACSTLRAFTASFSLAHSYTSSDELRRAYLSAVLDEAVAAHNVASDALRAAYAAELGRLRVTCTKTEPSRADDKLVHDLTAALAEHRLQIDYPVDPPVNGFVSFGFVDHFMLLTDASGAGLYVSSSFGGGTVFEVLTSREFTLSERLKGWHDPAVRAAVREYTRRKLKSLAPEAAAQPA